jgi:hypothetical protein
MPLRFPIAILYVLALSVVLVVTTPALAATLTAKAALPQVNATA